MCRTLGLGIVSILCLVILGFAIWEARYEQIRLDKRENKFVVERFRLVDCLGGKVTIMKLSNIQSVFAVKKGKGANTFYVLSVTFKNGQTVKILQTRNARRI